MSAPLLAVGALFALYVVRELLFQWRPLTFRRGFLRDELRAVPCRFVGHALVRTLWGLDFPSAGRLVEHRCRRCGTTFLLQEPPP